MNEAVQPFAPIPPTRPGPGLGDACRSIPGARPSDVGSAMIALGSGGPTDDPARFESLMADLSAAFVNLPADDVDARIEGALRRVVEFLGVERASLAEVSAEDGALWFTHSYVAPGFPPSPPAVLDTQLPWFAARIRRGDVVRLVDLPDDLPPEAVQEREYCGRVGLRSQLTVPLRVGGAVVFAIGCAAFRGRQPWPDDLVRRFRLLGEVFANALARRRADEALRRREDEAARLRDQLSRTARATTLGALAAAIAHEVNQPLCAIVANAEATLGCLADGSADPAEVREALQDIVADGRRAGEIIRRIRAMLRTRQHERAPFDLHDAVREVADLLRHQLTRDGVAVAFDFAADLGPVAGDRVQVQQVVYNLMVNGCEAVAGGPADRRRLAVTTERTGDHVTVTVRDTGPGVAAGLSVRVFDPFFTTKADGTGVGLSICRTIVEAHGGRIWAEPAGGGAPGGAGPGAAFRFTLPLAPGRPS